MSGSAAAETAPTTSVTLTARSALDPVQAGRTVVRLHRDVLAGLGLSTWDSVLLAGRRETGVLVAVDRQQGAGEDELCCDDLVLANLGLRDGDPVGVRPVRLAAATALSLSAPAEVTRVVPADLLLQAVLGKAVRVGDTVSLLPQDLAPFGPDDVVAARSGLLAALGSTLPSTLVSVLETEPAGAVLVTGATLVRWRAGRGAEPDGSQSGPGRRGPAGERGTPPAAAGPVEVDRGRMPSLADLPGLDRPAATLGAWLSLALHRRGVLASLGDGGGTLGVLVHGARGVGRRTLVRAVAQHSGATVVRCSAPGVAAMPVPDAVAALGHALSEATQWRPAVLLLEDLEALAPAGSASPVLPTLLQVVRQAAATDGIAVVATAAGPDAVDPQLRAAGTLDQEVGVPAPDRAGREAVLGVLLRQLPTEPDVDLAEVAARTPSFVPADLVAVRRDAAVRAAVRQPDAARPAVSQADLMAAVAGVRPSGLSGPVLVVPDSTLDDVGGMVETKQALTETVLWPLAHPETFARLGIQPPRGVLLYGPPGCGKTHLVRALAGSGQANVLSVKGPELMSKWVGESERGVRELFRRAREAAPALIFLDEMDSLAPARGQSTDSGVGDRVVASLLTELDGIEGLQGVVVLGATNRPDMIDPAVLRPGRLERLVYVPPPDGPARAEILRVSSRGTPFSADVDLAWVGAELAGYSAADCAALVREAALTAMRRSLDASEVTAADLDAARRVVRPSLRPEQVAHLEAYARQRQGG